MKVQDFAPPSIPWLAIELGLTALLSVPLAFTLPVSFTARRDVHTATELWQARLSESDLQKSGEPITVESVHFSCASGAPVDESYMNSHILVVPEYLPLADAPPNKLVSSDGVHIGDIYRDRIRYKSCNTSPEINEDNALQTASDSL